MSPRAYHFDLDGTLVGLEVPFERVVSDAAASAGTSAVSASAFGRALQAALNTDPTPIETAARTAAPDIDAIGFREAFIETEVEHTRARPDAAAVLERLAGEHPIGVLTNGVGRLQREKLGATGLDEYVDDIVVSGEEGVGKPDPGIYRIAAERLPAPRRTIVADEFERDLRPALEAGWDAILLGEPADCPAPVPAIEDLSELLP